MIGTRLPDNDYPTEAGGYAKMLIADKDSTEPIIAWCIKVPTGGPACIIGQPNRDGTPYHWVEEHEDGTITVQPNPPDAPAERRNSNSILWNGWHGYIHRGEWRQC